MIVSGGVNIFASKIEAALCEHDSVEEAVVVGTPHPEWGEAVVAVVRLRGGTAASRQHAASLQTHCAARLNRIERPKHFLFVDTFPRNVNGKLRKQEVKTWAASQPLPW